jgi:histidine kinase
MEELGDTHTDSMSQVMSSDLNRAYRRALNQSLFWGVIASALVASGIAAFLTMQIVRPIRKMQQASSRIATGRYSERLDTKAPGEIGELAESFNAMAAALESVESRRVELLGNVAHEFRTPLSSLRGYLEGVEDGLFQADQPTTEACLKQVGKLERLLDDLSLLSRVEAGVEEIKVESVNVLKLLEQVLDSFTPSFAAKGVRLELIKSINDSLPVRADPQRTTQILTNLISNALRYTPSGGNVTLWVSVEKTKVVFHVQDTGTGISLLDLPHIFSRFYRTDKARAGESGGSGIGLTIAKYFVEAQGGTIGVESELRKGSHFFFTLPLHEQPLALARLEAEPYRS